MGERGGMMNRKVKIFDGGFHNEEEKINLFLEENKAIPISISVHHMHDLFQDGVICNQWQTIVLIYESEVE